MSLQCSVCGRTKAKSHMYRLGLSEPVQCKACAASPKPAIDDDAWEAERLALDTTVRALDRVPQDTRIRVLRYLTTRYGDDE